MSTPPIMTPSESRERREAAARRRTRRRAMVAAGVIVLAALAAGLALGLSGGAKGRTGPSQAAHRATAVATVTTPALSPAGLVLAKPAFALHGAGVAAQDSVHLVFHNPPRAGLLFNLDTGQVLWQRNAALRAPIASLTKMMTALLTVQSSPAGAPVLVTPQAVAEGGSKVGVLPLGKHVRLESMLYGLLLPSGNDASVALAQHVAGSITGFVKRMNEEAASLGMGCTRYSSPSGYYDAGNFSCPEDLALLAHVDLAQPRIARIVHTYTATLPFPIAGGKLYLTNNNPLLIYGYPGTTGMKTGYTIAAGRCLVATAERHGVRLGVVLLHSSEPGTQARKLLDRGFEGVYHLPPVSEPAIPPGV
jgi:D-alanyl-D-alanine carboxypeptidase (penicillin-binding protein 5/6)